ncbi:MAG: UTP--glucose-1-phosphate uridylyltransferase GalU [Gammaproteobacteria bacterium]
MTNQVRKAVFPVAGLGTRFLPATKANPKEMLPVVDKPLIQYAVEEAVAAGITDLVFVTSSSKRAIEDHFDRSFELEHTLESRGKNDVLDQVRNMVPEGVNCVYVRQPVALGLGHAVLCAEPVVGNEPFAVILADDLIDGGNRPCMKQMTDLYRAHGVSILGVERVPEDEVYRYGIVSTEGAMADGVEKVTGIVEKPKVENAPSNLGVVGRYVLNPRIFQLLKTQETGSGGEIQLTDAIARMLNYETVLSYPFEGVRYDCGSKLGYLMATMQYALKHPELKGEFREYLESLNVAPKPKGKKA